ncbi:MAG: hypothetical protein ACE5KV_03995, partial [Thermoplasmata archaeon]
TIEVENVDRGFLEDAVRKAISSKTVFKRLDYEIEEILEVVDEFPQKESDEEKFKHWVEVAQKQWDKKKGRFMQQIKRLEEEKRKLQEEKEALAELRRQDEKRYAELQRSHEAVSKMLDTLAKGRVRDPSQACSDWVGDWMVTARRVESQLADSVGDMLPHEVSDLLSRTEESILKKASRELALESGGVEELSALADGTTWEETEQYKKMIDGYNTALEEMKYLEEIRSGRVEVPPTVVDIVTKEIAEEEKRRVIAEFESARERFSVQSEKAERASSYLRELERVGKLRELVPQFRKFKSLPLAIICGNKGRKWFCDVLFPYGEEEGFVETVMDDIAFNTLRRHCQKVPERERTESVCICKAPVPGKYRSWKDVSRFQEKVQGTLMDGLKRSVLSDLGISWVISKVMNQRG